MQFSKEQYCAILENTYSQSGDYGLKVTPVPIPNTKVKLQSADGSRALDSEANTVQFSENIYILIWWLWHEGNTRSHTEHEG